MITFFYYIVYIIRPDNYKDHMGTLQLQDISLAYGERDILRHISCTIDTQTHAALAGVNGSGKSTLLKIIKKEIEPDSGVISTTKNLQVSYLPQTGITFKERSLYEELESAFDRYAVLLKEKYRIAERLASHNSNTKETNTLLKELDAIEEYLLTSEYYHREAKILQIAEGLGFSSADIHRSCHEFPGGWQMRIALSKVLLEHPDILLLDEPTNYLDVEARVWLKNYLLQYKGGYLLVSHDRYFLDETTNEVFELFGGALKRYAGNYTLYERIKQQETDQLIQAYAQQQAEIHHMEEFIERFRSKATKAKQVQSRIKQLEKMERIELPQQHRRLSFSFPDTPHSGNDIFRLEHISKAYGEHVVIPDLDLFIGKGDRLAVTGKNGMGKTTLLRILSQQDTDFAGSIKVGTGVKIGYFAQEVDTFLYPDRTVIEELQQEAPTSSIPSLRNHLGSFLFQGDDIYKSISMLSGGEKSRLALLKILLNPCNVLILDEPTNHLDISSKDMLLSALKSFNGTLIFVSHDIDFIKQLATKILYLSEEGMELFEGDYDYFSWKLEQKEAVEKSRTEDDRAGSHPPSGPGQKPSIDRMERNRIRNRLKTLEREEPLLIEQLEQLELELSDLHHRMSLPEYYSDGEKIRMLKQEIESLEKTIQEKTDSWDVVTQEIEELRELYEK